MHDCVNDKVMGGKESDCADCLREMLIKKNEEWAERGAKITALELQKSEHEAQLEWAWSIIASAGPEGCIGNWKKMDPRWVEAAEKWRDKYHEILRVKPIPESGVEEATELCQECCSQGCTCPCHIPTDKPQTGCQECAKGWLKDGDYHLLPGGAGRVSCRVKRKCHHSGGVMKDGPNANTCPECGEAVR